MSPRSLFAMSTLTLLSLAACGPAATVVPTSPPPETDQGAMLYGTQCSACHGLDGSGSDLAPAASGHTAEQIVTQVREPVGAMPAFSAEALSDAHLAQIAAYLETLGEGTSHPEIMPSAEERMHLEAALEAIKDPADMDRATAVSHLQQAADLATEAAASVYQELIEAIQTRKAGEARHELQEILGMEEGH